MSSGPLVWNSLCLETKLARKVHLQCLWLKYPSLSPLSLFFFCLPSLPPHLAQPMRLPPLVSDPQLYHRLWHHKWGGLPTDRLEQRAGGKGGQTGRGSKNIVCMNCHASIDGAFSVEFLSPILRIRCTTDHTFTISVTHSGFWALVSCRVPTTSYLLVVPVSCCCAAGGLESTSSSSWVSCCEPPTTDWLRTWVYVRFGKVFKLQF